MRPNHRMTRALAVWILVVFLEPPADAQRAQNPEVFWKWDGEALHLQNRSSERSLLVVEVLRPRRGREPARHEYRVLQASDTLAFRTAGAVAVVGSSDARQVEFGDLLGVFACPTCEPCLPPRSGRSPRAEKPHGMPTDPGFLPLEPSPDAGCPTTAPDMSLTGEDDEQVRLCSCADGRIVPGCETICPDGTRVRGCQTCG